MTPQRARELLGGLAAGILTAEERQTLFAAALHDQVLFNEVADELEFAAFLQSPEARAQLANRIEVAPEPRPWWALSPRWLALSGALAASIIIFVAVLHRPGEVPSPSAVPAAPQPTIRPKPEAIAKSSPAAPPPPAATATASLRGTVRDPAGAPIPGAAVDIANPATNTTAHAISDADGRFIAPSLPPGGPYTATATARGFAPQKKSGITLADNQPVHVDIPLQLGEVTESVQVAAAPPPVQHAPNQQPSPQNLTQVAVLDFANGSQQNQSGTQAADLLSTQLGNGGQVGVIARDKVQQAAQSQNVTGRPPNAQEAAALGRSVGADAVILGSVQPSGTLGAVAAPRGAMLARKAEPNVSVTAEIIDTKKAQPMAKVSAGDTSLQRATASVGSQIESRLARPVEGKVTSLNAEMVSVQFAVPPVPPVGTHCDVLRGTEKLGEIVVTSVEGQTAVGKFSGTGRPREGDRVTSSR